MVDLMNVPSAPDPGDVLNFQYAEDQNRLVKVSRVNILWAKCFSVCPTLSFSDFAPVFWTPHV